MVGLHRPEDAVGKILRLHPADPVFEPFSRTPDLLGSDLMHRSTHNGSEGIRAAMVYHYSPAGTRDGSTGFTPNRWVPVRRPAAEAD